MPSVEGTGGLSQALPISSLGGVAGLRPGSDGSATGMDGAQRTARSLVWIGRKVQRQGGREDLDLGYEGWGDLDR